MKHGNDNSYLQKWRSKFSLGTSWNFDPHVWRLMSQPSMQSARLKEVEKLKSVAGRAQQTECRVA